MPSRLFLWSLVSALAGFLFGFDTVVISGAEKTLQALWGLSPEMHGLAMSAALWGTVLGSLLGSWPTDHYGRKPTLLWIGVLFLIGSLWSAVANDVYSFMAARFLGGIAIGVSTVAAPLYISEISPPRLRGRMVTLFQLAICVGIVAAILINTGLLAWHDRIKGTTTDGLIGFMVDREVWRSMLGMETLPALLFFVSAIIIPESPRWLAEKGMSAKAREVLERINGPEIAATELADIEATVVEESGALGELFKPGLRQVLFMALFLSVISEFSGITTIWNFGPEIIRGQGIQLTSEMTGMVVIASSLSIFTLVAVWLMDVAGRRRLLFWGNLGCFLSLIALGALLGKADAPSAMKVAAAATFVACFAFSMGPIKWVFMSEVFPTRIRGRAVAISSLAVWTADAILNQLFPLMRDHWGKSTTFYVFAAVLIPQFYFVWKIMPETKGKSLEEIEKSWLKH